MKEENRERRVTRMIEMSNKYKILATCFTLISLLDVFFDPEGGGKMFLRNVS
jgi:hypothetical protein